MRIWSIHPKYLDAKGLVALWRESLLALHVLEGRTKGYKNHPQLLRFKTCSDPIDSINHYLSVVHEEAGRRQYSFDDTKLNWTFKPCKIPVTSGQVNYEANHLLNKLRERDYNKYLALKDIENFDPHPLFKVVDGAIESWEIT